MAPLLGTTALVAVFRIYSGPVPCWWEHKMVYQLGKLFDRSLKKVKFRVNIGLRNSPRNIPKRSENVFLAKNSLRT